MTTLSLTSRAATLATPLKAERAGDPNKVKVVLDRAGFALYFSRAPIPFDRDAALASPGGCHASGNAGCHASGNAGCHASGNVGCHASGTLLPEAWHPGSRPSPGYLLHLGIYAYRVGFLRAYAQLPPTPAELVEKLEQLRALEHGHRIAVGLTDYHGIGIDTPADYEAFVARIGVKK